MSCGMDVDSNARDGSLEQDFERMLVQSVAELEYDLMGVIFPKEGNFALYKGCSSGSAATDYEDLRYDAAVMELISFAVAPADRGRVLLACELERVVYELDVHGVYSFMYDRMIDGGGRARKFIQYRYLDDSRSKIFFCQRDVTFQHEQEQERIRRIEEEQHARKQASLLLENILDTTQTAIFWKNTQLEFMGANRAFLDFFGVESLQSLEVGAWESIGLDSFLKAGYSEELLTICEGVITTRQHREIETESGVRHVVVSWSPIREQGVIAGLVGSFEDVTEEVERARQIELLNDELKDAVRTAERATQAEKTFLSNMSHDMRTPLNGIIGFTRMALEADDEQARLSCLAKIDYSSKLMLDLVNDVLDLSKIESGRMELNPVAFEAHELFDATVDSVRLMAQGKEIDLSVSLEAAKGCYLEADRLRVQQVLLNLLSNAVKYTKPGGSVWLGFDIVDPPVRGCNTCCVVKDTGIGMSDAFQKRMFEPFSEEMRGFESNATQGTGLGLSIVSRIVELMGGFIEVDSKLGVGTTMAVYLPIPLVDASQLSDTQGASAAAASMEGLQVMVCEDNDLNAEIAASILCSKGVCVTRVRNGKEALDAFAASAVGAFAALLMDVRMPVMDGLSATRAIRALERDDAQTVPVIAMTADAFAEDVRRCVEAGMTAHVPKPIDPDVLMAELARACSGCV